MPLCRAGRNIRVGNVAGGVNYLNKFTSRFGAFHKPEEELNIRTVFTAP